MKVVRIVEVPAVEAAWLRTTTWWDTLSPRERILVGTLGVLLALAILVYGVIKPLQNARAQALSDIRTYETLSARIRAADALGPSSPPPRTGTPEAIVTSSASAMGLTAIAQATPGGVRATIAGASYDAVVNWLADLARTSTLTATRVEFRSAPVSGQVVATVEFTG